MGEDVRTIDAGTALGGRLSWAHIGVGALSNVVFAIDGEFARNATAEPTPDTSVIGVDYDLVYVAYGREIVRFQLVSDGTVVAIDPIPAILARLLSEADLPR
ncbi:hypothetical protein MTP03_09490 [Tsukamurella sp. PLM1]|nr:hypothetical protein MTP03_09490 [Tsukamurella sp. PLM1]